MGKRKRSDQQASFRSNNNILIANFGKEWIKRDRELKKQVNKCYRAKKGNCYLNEITTNYDMHWDLWNWLDDDYGKINSKFDSNDSSIADLHKGDKSLTKNLKALQKNSGNQKKLLGKQADTITGLKKLIKKQSETITGLEKKIDSWGDFDKRLTQVEIDNTIIPRIQNSISPTTDWSQDNSIDLMATINVLTARVDALGG